MPKRKDRPDDESDNSSLEPYSDELDVSSPEILEYDEAGHVVQHVKQEEDEESEDIGADDSGDEHDRSSEAERDAGSESESSAEGDSVVDAEVIPVKQRTIAAISFGLLAQAQEVLGPKKKKRKVGGGNEEKLQLLRERLQELRGRHEFKSNYKEEDSRENSAATHYEELSEERLSSKHAPAVKSSKHSVSRKRQVIDVPRNIVRDPRFDPVSDTRYEDKARKNYKFLDDYVDKEIKDLKTKLKSAKPSKKSKQPTPKIKLTEEDIEAIKRELVQKESRKAQHEADEREREVRREHRKKEKDLVKQGKKPYFLKDSEVKKQTLVKRFEGLSEGKREKVLEKKRRRLAAKERRFMPNDRRV